MEEKNKQAYVGDMSDLSINRIIIAHPLPRHLLTEFLTQKATFQEDANSSYLESH